MTREIESILIRFKGGEAVEYGGEEFGGQKDYISFTKDGTAMFHAGSRFGLIVEEPTRRGRLVHYPTGPTCGECRFAEVLSLGGKVLDCGIPGDSRRWGLQRCPETTRHPNCPAPGGLWAWKGE